MKPRAARSRAQAAWIASVPVERWMQRSVVTVGLEASVGEAAALMRVREIRHLPVLDATGRLVGIVTDRDLRQVVLDVAIGRLDADGVRPEDRGLRDVMTWGVVTATPTMELREAAAVMRERRLGALPVVDAAGHVVGILTERDLLDALQAVLRERVVGPAPAAGEPSGPYDPGLPPPPDADPWQNSAAPD